MLTALILLFELIHDLFREWWLTRVSASRKR